MMFRRHISPRPEHPIFDEKRFWIGISVGVTWSIVMYLFLQAIRSAIFFVFGFDQTEIVVIDFPEFRFYSFIIAFFSIVFGAYQFLEFTLFKNHSFFKKEFQQKVILGNLRYVIWTTLFISFKFILTCFLTLLIGVTSVWKLYSIGWWISILLCIFLYFYFWNNLKRIIPNTLKISLFCFPISLALAFGLAQINPINIAYYQESCLNRTIHYSKQIDIPEATDLDRERRKSRIINFYIAHESDNPHVVKYYINHTKIQLENIPIIIENFKNIKPQNIHNLLIANVIIDKNVKMKNVYPLLSSLRYSGIYKIGLVGIEKNDDSRKRYFTSFPHHLLLNLIPHDQPIIDLVKHIKRNPTAPKNTWKKYLNKNKHSYPRTIEELEIYYTSGHSIEILSDGSFYFNDKKIKSENLIDSITTTLQNNIDQPISFFLDVHPNAPYRSYFYAHHEFKKAKREIRNNIAQEKFSENYKYLPSDQQKEVRTATPFSLHQAYNDSEKFLYNFFKKKKNTAISN